MLTFTKNLVTGRFVVILLVVVVIGIATGVVISTGPAPSTAANQPKNAGLPLVTSASAAVRVIGVARSTIGESPAVEVSLQNISTKNIKAYSLGTGKRWVTRGYYFSDEAFAPNTVETQIIPLSAAGSNPTTTELSVSGVMFDDGTTDGDSIAVFRLKEARDGIRDQATLLVPCLRQLPSTIRSEDEGALSRCEAEASASSAKGRSSDYDDGMQNAKREFVKQLVEIKTKVRSRDFSGAGNQRDRVLRIFQNLN